MENLIQNAQILAAAIGRFPTFHDAEVIELTLIRKSAENNFPSLETVVRVVDVKTIGEKSELVYSKFDVKLKFVGIFGLKIENFNHQNVISDLIIKKVTDENFQPLKTDVRLLGVVGKSEIEKIKLSVKFEYCFGVEAEFLCDSAHVNSVEKTVE